MLLIFIYKFISVVLELLSSSKSWFKVCQPLKICKNISDNKSKFKKKERKKSPLLIYSSIKKHWGCPRGLNLFLHQAWMDTISDKTAAQLNFWNSNDCTTYDKRWLKKAYVADQTWGQPLCTFLSKRLRQYNGRFFFFMQMHPFNQPTVQRVLFKTKKRTKKRLN